jgi:ankyrin repeat protein
MANQNTMSSFSYDKDIMVRTNEREYKANEQKKYPLLKPFIEFCKNGDLVEAQNIYYTEPNIIILDKSHEAFKMACTYGHTHVAQWLLSNNHVNTSYDFISYDFKKHQPQYMPFIPTFIAILISVCKEGHLHIILWLISIANEIKVSYSFEEVFLLICNEGNLEMVQHLLLIKPTINADYEEAFIIACKQGHLHVAKWLLLIKPNVSINSEKAFIHACKHGHLHVVKWLLLIKPNISINSKKKAFRHACNKGYLGIAKLLLSINPYLDVFESDKSAVTAACIHGHLPILKWIFLQYPRMMNNYCKNGFYINNNYNNGFYLACISGHLPVLKWLYRENNDVYNDSNAQSIFESACKNGHLHIIEWLHNINDDRINISFECALLKACEYGHLHVAKWLMLIDSCMKDCELYYKAFLVAAKHGHLHIAKWVNLISSNIKCICYSSKVFNSNQFIVDLKQQHVSTLELDLELDIDMARWFQLFRPYKYTINYNKYDDTISFHINTPREEREEKWKQIKYFVWISSNHSPNKENIIYNLPFELSRKIILYL